MKLQYLRLFNKYRSLDPFEYIFQKHKLLKNHIDPICLVGLNGSGKSNFLELIADIFYDLEIFFLYEVEDKLYKEDSPKYFAYAGRNQEPIYFEIRYRINTTNARTGQTESHDIQIVRRKDEKQRSRKKTSPEFRIKTKKSDSLFENYEPLSIKEARNFLPLIVGYTSGLNDLLSMPFIELQDFYAQQVAKEARPKGANKIRRQRRDHIESPNMMLLNYESNSAIVLANLLLADTDKLLTIQETLRIQKLNSFRIVIRWNKLYTKRKLEVTPELQSYIDQLHECATLKDIRKSDPTEGGEIHTLDFVYNDVTKSLFKEKFKTSKMLFEALTKLTLLNTLCIQAAQRKKLRKRREKGQLVKFPQISSFDKIFSIEKVELVLKIKEDSYVRTEYEKISDGEHQFIHIIGGILLYDEQSVTRDLLYLLDEPDTHFNPLWRSDFFYQLEQMLDNKEIEFILTTHSPFIISDCHGYNVLKFIKEDERVNFSRVANETYGSTFENVLDTVFHSEEEKNKHFKNQIAKLSFNKIQEIHEKIENATTNDELKAIEPEIRLLGESMDRLEVLKQFGDKELELSNGK